MDQDEVKFDEEENGIRKKMKKFFWVGLKLI